ncbi:MAG TPA: alpha/beta fold hydrolase [Anaerolineaceae bacterium]|nr:alpha/beta fold hydrolase [Anaerolineaceae bacterium]
MQRPYFLLVILALLGAGCGQAAPTGEVSIPTQVAEAVGARLTAGPATETDTPGPPPASATPLPLSASSTPTATITPTPAPFFMSIQALREGSYPGSDITIVNELAQGSNYHRYYAYYLSEGLKIYGLLTVPNGDPPDGGWPAIVFNHGYIPSALYKTTERYVAYVDRLARAGYVVYKIDYRGHDRSEGDARGAYGDPGYEVDVLNALSSLQRYPGVNAQKMGMWGHSMGGFLTLRAMVISKEIKAGVIWSGVVGSYLDLMYRWRRAGPTRTPPPNSRGWRQEWLAQFGTPDENPDFWNSVSATAYLADLSGPLELHASLADEEVPAEFSQDLAAQIEAAGKPYELYTYKDDDHNLSKYFTTAMDRTVAFFDQYLK